MGNNIENEHYAPTNQPKQITCLSKDKIDQLILHFSKFLNQQQLLMIKTKLESAPECRFEQLLLVDVKDPIELLLFSIFLGPFGIDRFILGKVGTGIAKLILGWITFGIWWLIDVCTISKQTNQYNFDKLLLIL